jgi:heterodisulfide reductase subunit A-like polyferredoxin
MTLVDCAPYYKDAMLGRFYAICNCCSCCCGAMQAQRSGSLMLASSGFVARVDDALCAACGECAEFCQFAAISVDDGFARIDAAACMGCGVCVAHCPQEAIELVRDPAKGEPLEIQKLIAEAAVTAQD